MRELPEEVLYDKRLIQRHIEQGLVSQDEVDKRLTGLGDLESQGEVIDLDELMELSAAHRQEQAHKAS